MTTPEQLIAMAKRLDIYRNLPVDVDVREAAALLREVAEEMEWQDMKTAPKDGTWVLLTGGAIDYGWDSKTYPAVVAAQFIASTACEEGRWQFANYDSGYYGEYENPTKWRPLPKGEA